MSTKPKPRLFCKDCAHSFQRIPVAGEFYCRIAPWTEPDFVTGESHEQFCMIERANGCGHDGKNWKAREGAS